MKTVHAAAAALGAAVILVSGCAPDTPSPAATTPTVSSPTPSPSYTKDARYGSVVELRDALIAAGYKCPSWLQDDRIKLAAESGQCSDADVLSTYATQADLDEYVDGWRSLGLEDNPIVVGPNWVLNLPEEAIPQVRERLGGTVFR